MNWFEKHLNLTALLYVIVWFAVGAPFVNHEVALAVVGIVGEVLFLVLSAWVLRKKGQTRWFLVALVFFWWLIFLIPNKNTVRPVIEYEYDDEPKA